MPPKEYMNFAPLQITKSIRSFLEGALAEDIGCGDITTLLTIDAPKRSEAVIKAKQDMLLAGAALAVEVFRIGDGETEIVFGFSEGATVREGEVIAKLQGSTSALLSCERVALNILQQLSGIATLTNKYVEAVNGLPVKILDTRKIMPGIRSMAKYAVRAGGGFNHRSGLYDGMLVKDNHIAACGGIKRAVQRIRKSAPHLLKVEVEVKSMTELHEALAAGADVIMLDNMGVNAMKEAVDIVSGRVPLEASGNVNLENVRSIAETGVNMISVGALTHSASAVDISMRIGS